LPATRTFSGGCHPGDYKSATARKAIEPFPLPEEAVVILSQHIGAPAKAVVAKGDAVKTGQLIGEAGGFVSAPVHSPVTGTVDKVGAAPHPLGMSAPAVVIRRDGDQWAEGVGEPADWRALDAKAIRAKILAGGIVGMGGATFPTHVKLSPPPEKAIDTVILNGVECEPFLTADHRLMLETPEPIAEGLEIILRAVGAARGIVAIEANKPDAADTMRRAVASIENVEVRVLPVKYPQGAEKQLIVALTGREVPSGGLPMDVSVR